MRTKLRQLFRDDAGQALIVITVAMVMLMGMMAFAVDVGRVLNARKQLQASTDAAATAAAQELPTQSRANVTAKARLYSAEPSQKNYYYNLPGVSVTTTFKCLTSITGLPTTCSTLNTAQANAIAVTSTTSVPTFFAKILGIPSMTISTTATATMKAGALPPLDIIIVLDTTGSMTAIKLAEAKEGIRTLLGTLWPCAQGLASCSGQPVVDQAGLFVFPGVSNATSVGREVDCLGTDPVTVDYSASPIYEIIPMTNDYRTSTTAALNPNSNFVKAVDGKSGCPGLEVIGGFGSYFATPIAQAQAKVVSAGRANVQNVIIFVSDGDATDYTTPPLPGTLEPCQEAVNAAVAAKNAGTWVYSIGYGVPSSGGCDHDDANTLTALQTMQRINSDYPSLTSGKYFNAPDGSDLTNVFAKIGTDLTTSRLVDDSTP